jgi:hypothetical protein
VHDVRRGGHLDVPRVRVYRPRPRRAHCADAPTIAHLSGALARVKAAQRRRTRRAALYARQRSRNNLCRSVGGPTRSGASCRRESASRNDSEMDAGPEV